MTKSFPDEMIKVGSYDWPRPPPTSSLRARFRQLRERTGFGGQNPADEAPDTLEGLQGQLLPQSIWEELEARYRTLLDARFLGATDNASVKALVTMPSLPGGIVEDWAKINGLSLKQDGAAEEVQTPRSLIPLASMAWRTVPARAAARRQLSEIANATRRSDSGELLLFGSSWTWTYLAQTSSIRAVVSEAYCFPAYDCKSLAQLIADHIGSVQLKSVETREDILACKDDGDPKDNYLAALAATANGCPWAALQMLEDAAAQQTNGSEKQDEDDSSTENIRWVCDPSPPNIPEHLKRAPEFLLHALLIHGPLTEDEIAQVLPLQLPVGLSVALDRVGLVEFKGDKLQIVCRNYPHVRDILTKAGFPADQL
ncbi:MULTISPECIES: hypothetical protein [Halocynthiibacter]|uniref:Uncharacterized protein n=1 Tax=Halocynthiibacter halioticoli TaxID=2986804 RepID=A0AAE3LRQ6_9RHOB|nr:MULTISPECIES: hypothetical protein [Halocynthiibacter]MCV6824863.1 hypothetical protein [Halocynthiibacter halioticoli]MCW4057864.1 hypothetical protein [Halocynthiibacter sp. SDUM655004]